METLPFIGHRDSYLTLTQLRDSARLPHALLFLGPEGSGKQLVARQLAKSILCSEMKEPCGQCRSCHLYEGGQHPDLWLLESEGGRIKIDKVRDLKRSLNLPPLVGNFHVVLMPEAHHLNIAAANALLKTLEEPPSSTYFFLVTHALGWIPRTIVSRCQKIRLSPLSPAELQKILQNQGQSCSAHTLNWAQGSAHIAHQLSQASPETPSLKSLQECGDSFNIDQAYNLVQSQGETEKILAMLSALLHETHQRLTQINLASQERFSLLVFAERILELRRQLRQNANPKLHLLRLLMFFREPLESRL